VCDYSLYAVRQRLACQGDELVTFRFDTGSLGFVSVCDAEKQKESAHGRREPWRRMLDWLRLGMGRRCDATAVCMPPGARIELEITAPVARAIGVPAGRCEAVFDEISAESFMYRDALRFGDGRMFLLQSLPEGIHGKVLTLGSNDVDEAALLPSEWDAQGTRESRRPVPDARHR